MPNFSLKTITTKESPGIREIAISGAMTIHHADEIRTTMLVTLNEAEEVRMLMAQVTEIDLVGLQLLCAAHKTSIAMNKRFTVAECGDGNVKGTIQGSGFRRHVGCVQDINHTCLWLGGGK